jgi:Uma2 family endonuclease
MSQERVKYAISVSASLMLSFSDTFARRWPMSTATQPNTVELESNGKWKDVLDEIMPPQGEWSEEEYLVLTDHRTRPVEFTDGFLEPLPMPTAGHQMILGALYLVFTSFFNPLGGNVIFAPLRLQVRPGKYREPDLLLLLSSTDPRGQNRYWLGADLVVEVVNADKPERDLVYKRSDYADGKVPEYWIVNPLTQTITVLELRDGAYFEAGAYPRGQSARSVQAPDFTVDVTTIFDAAAKK